MHNGIGRTVTLVLAIVCAACDADDGDDSEAQTPPRSGHTDIQAWLAEGLDWTCEADAHDITIGVSPHGQQRICSNTLMSGHASGEYPVGASAVKELLYDDGTIFGYAVSLHVEAGTGGDSWYWYEQVHADHPAPHDANGVVADGLGDGGPAKSICVGCHMAAGLDEAHPGHDFVYVQVK
jgi:hypothetical protein